MNIIEEIQGTNHEELDPSLVEWTTPWPTPKTNKTITVFTLSRRPKGTIQCQVITELYASHPISFSITNGKTEILSDELKYFLALPEYQPETNSIICEFDIPKQAFLLSTRYDHSPYRSIDDT